MSLEGLQVEFIHAVFAPNASKTLVARHIKPSKALNAEQQFAVYRGSVVGGLTNALGEIYPRLKQLTGARFFNALAKKYIETHPSTSPSLDDYGEDMRAFCTGFQPLHDLPYAADLAAAEWAWHRAFHSKDRQALNAADLQARVSQSAALPTVRLHPSATVISSRHPLFTIWQFIEGARAGEESAALDLSVVPANTPTITQERAEKTAVESIVVWREDFHVQVRVIDHATAIFIEALSTSPCLEAVMQLCLTRAPSIDPKDFSQCLSTLLTLGLLCSADDLLEEGCAHD